MEASSVRVPLSGTRVPRGVPLLRLRSDEQLVAQFRLGSEDAFRVLHDRYRQRLFAYVRQMLPPGPRSDAEDVLQDVFARAYVALRADERPMAARAWLYRVAHNRCVDALRRPAPLPAELPEVAAGDLHDPLVEASRREDLALLVSDLGRLPEQQRSALLMRELEGLSYADLAAALDCTLPAVKSLLVRARMGLAEAACARDTACEEIRGDLALSCENGRRASALARRHMRDCSGCRAYRSALRGTSDGLGALSPAGGPLAALLKLLGLGGSGAAVGGLGGGAAAGGGSAGGGLLGGAGVLGGGGLFGGGSAGLAVGGGAVAATATKVAVVMCCVAGVAGGASEIKSHAGSGEPVTATARAAQAPAAESIAPHSVDPQLRHAAPAAPPPTAPPAPEPVAAAPIAAADPAPEDAATVDPSGGTLAPDEPAEATETATTDEVTDGSATGEPEADKPAAGEEQTAGDDASAKPIATTPAVEATVAGTDPAATGGAAPPAP